MHKRTLLLIFAALISLVTGCSRLDTETLLLGTWYRYDKDPNLSSDISLDKKNLTLGEDSYSIESISDKEMTWKHTGTGICEYFRKK